MATTVWIDCPRCSGRGHANWHPDSGICYRCRGNGEVRINIEKHQAALRFLRGKYVQLKRALCTAVGQEQGLIEEQLAYCVQDGRRVRYDLEAAGVEVH